MPSQAKSHYAETAVLNLFLRATAFTPPASVYAALFTAAPGEAGGGTEVSGTAYARQAVTFSAPTTSTTGAQVTNDADVNFPTAGSSWGTVTHFGIFDAVSGGNLLYYAALTSSIVVSSGDPVKFSAGALVIGED